MSFRPCPYFIHTTCAAHAGLVSFNELLMVVASLQNFELQCFRVVGNVAKESQKMSNKET